MLNPKMLEDFMTIRGDHRGVGPVLEVGCLLLAILLWLDSGSATSESQESTAVRSIEAPPRSYPLAKRADRYHVRERDKYVIHGPSFVMFSDSPPDVRQAV